MKLIAVGLVVTFSLGAQTPDLYPQVRALVLEAEAASANMRLLKDHGNPHTWAADILARAGYLEDAETAYAKSPGPSSDPPFTLWRAWIVYGHRERAERLLESTTNSEERAAYFASFADMLWRTGDPEAARERYDAARAIAGKIVDPARQKQALATIDQGLRFVSDPPPVLLSQTPHPSPRRNVQDSSIPPFPITADGFLDIDPKEATARASANSELMKRLYDRAAAGDRAGLERITESATTPFQKALGLAGLEHILIQERQPELAERYAARIPETDSSSSLVKAEALSAAASAWLRALHDDRARANFESAKRLVSIVPDLPLGKVSVLVSIASAQFKGQMTEDGVATLRSAIELVLKLPLRPKPPPGVRRSPTPLGVHYRDETYDKILHAAVHAGAIQVANDAAEVWSKTDDNFGSELVDAWFDEGNNEEAIAAARRIEDVDLRISGLLNLARNLLDEAGAPIF